LTNVFLYSAPLVLLAFGLMCLLQEAPLRETTHPVAAQDEQLVTAPADVAPLVT
jgi:hypothetical protein